MTSLVHALSVVRSLRAGPISAREIAEATGLHWRKVYRLLTEIRADGAPLREMESDFERKGRGGSGATRYSLSAAGLIEWLAPRKPAR